jgi:subtilisin family serine protease
MRRLALLLGAAPIILAAVAGAAAQTAPTPTGANLHAVVTGLSEASAYSGPKSASGQIAQTDPSLLHQQGTDLVPVMIKYDFDATASYGGGVAGLAPTSPAVTGKPLADNGAAVAAYDQHIEAVAGSISGAVTQAVPEAKIGRTFTTVYGGVEAQVPAGKIADLLHVPGVAAVQKDALEQPLDDNTSFIGATNVWPSLGGSSTAGSNVVVGVIDTGVWPENPMLSATGVGAPPGGVLQPTSSGIPGGHALSTSSSCQFGDGSDTAKLGPVFNCNNKLIGAYAFLDTYLGINGSDGAKEFCDNSLGVCSPRDSEGHGTHTMTTAAGDCVASATLYGVNRGPVCGVAPGAHVIEYRVCLTQGCYDSDSIDAINQAIHDGVNVINFSIGGEADAYTDPVDLAFLDAFHAGVSVNASAGNDGPTSGTVEHGAPWITTVGASTGPRFFSSTLHLSTGSSTFDAPGVTITQGISSPTAVILAQNIPGEDALCQTKLSAGSAATGKIVLCERGTNARVDKGYNVFSGGAAGMILYNPVQEDLETDNHWLPTIHIDGPDTALLAYLNAHAAQTVNATWAQGTATATTPDVMAAFSSRGPSTDFIKPDVTAPGIQVLAGMTEQPDSNSVTDGPAGNDFQAIAGTSMSSPHAAGVAALIKASHPTWDPAEIKSAMMTSAAQGVLKEDGSTPADPFDDGSGSIRADAAVNPTVVFDETYQDYVNSENDPLHRIDLNLPSIDAPVMSGSIATTRRMTNVSGHSVTLNSSVAQPSSGSITVSPATIGPIANGGTATFTVTINGVGAPTGQEFGRVTLTPQGGGSSNVTIPVAFDVGQGAITLTHTCSPTNLNAGIDLAHCSVTETNTERAVANTSLTVTNQDAAKLDFKNITPPGSPINTDNGVQWSGTLAAAVGPKVNGFTDITGSGPAGGYFPLSTQGIAKIPSVGDDTISNYSVPTFYWGGEPYTQIGVGSNGYLVIGGGTTADISAVPEAFPDTHRPNNVIAPFWTDLDPSQIPGGSSAGVRIAVLTNGSLNWIVVDYNAVPNYSDPGTTHTGEVWLRVATGGAGTGPSSEQVTISYGAANAASGDSGEPNPLAIISGAENSDGTSGASISPAPANNTEWSVNTTPATTGGSVTIGYDASSVANNQTFHVLASLTSNITAGATQAMQTLTTLPDARVSITPSPVTNRVGTTRTLTISVAALNDAIDSVPATYTATASITNNGGNGAFVGGNTCTYSSAAPSCTVQISGSGAGTSTVNATTTVTLSGAGAITRTTGTAANTASGGSGAAAITWADATLGISPATDGGAVGAARTFTISVTPAGGTLDAGTFTATASVTSGPGAVTGPNTCTYTAGSPSCTVQVLSSTTGASTVHATTTTSVAGISLTKAADATETWVDGSISLSSPTAVPNAGTPQTFTISIAPVGGTIDAGTYTATASITNPGNFVNGVNTCTYTAAQRSCTVTVTASTGGSATLSANSTFKVNGISVKRTTGTATNTAAGGSGNQTQVWASGGGGGGGGGGASLAISLTPRSQTISRGGTASFTISVTNTGGGYLFAVGVTDAAAPSCNKTSGDISDFGALAPGVTDTYNCSATGVNGTFTNTATVTGQNGAGQQATANDSGVVTVNSPSAGGGGGGTTTTAKPKSRPAPTTKISIAAMPRTQTLITHETRVKSKTTGKWHTVYHYGTAHFTIKVTNTGTVALSGVIVTDAKSLDCARRLGKLPGGSSHTYTCTHPNVARGFGEAPGAGGKGRGTTVHATSPVAIVKVLAKRIPLGR